MVSGMCNLHAKFVGIISVSVGAWCKCLLFWNNGKFVFQQAESAYKTGRIIQFSCEGNLMHTPCARQFTMLNTNGLWRRAQEKDIIYKSLCQKCNCLIFLLTDFYKIWQTNVHWQVKAWMSLETKQCNASILSVSVQYNKTLEICYVVNDVSDFTPRSTMLKWSHRGKWRSSLCRNISNILAKWSTRSKRNIQKHSKSTNSLKMVCTVWLLCSSVWNICALTIVLIKH